ncbi:flagellar protein FliT [Gracilibacillus ureilyticus]|uniref:Flagellar protein FliT n=1 Tax=Gracilibacillus ureilyticus TaxID=531814 RepID=A0A1H9S9R3_9BACI|nr:hypothetical protein [Gracilibacillus ureilyticus]SER81345.1 flagellar protein FliT [Gracilibacillus ureilyticus]
MNPLKEYINLTQEMIQLLDQPIKSESREEAIKEIDSLLDKRETLVQAISPPYNAEDTKLGKQCLALDQELEPKLQLVLTKIKTSMRNNKKQTRSTKQYLNPYKQLSTYDGMFLDSKK